MLQITIRPWVNLKDILNHTKYPNMFLPMMDWLKGVLAFGGDGQ